MNSQHEIPAITLHQPWASLIAWGRKYVVSRPHPTAYRGPLAIHAAAGLPHEPIIITTATANALTAALGGDETDLPLGAVVAVARLADCRRITSVRDLPPRERDLDNYGPGRYLWRLDLVMHLIDPVPARGKPGLWTWTPPGQLHDIIWPSPRLRATIAAARR